MAEKSEIEKIQSEYTVKNGIIINPGKFEGESIATVYFYGVMLDGFLDDCDCCALDKSDYELFDISSDKKYAHLTEDSNGFVYLEYLTEDEYYKMSFASDEDESDDF